MPRKTAARDARRKSAPQAPTIQQFRALEERHGELIKLQRETLTQLANLIERFGAYEEKARKERAFTESLEASRAAALSYANTTAATRAPVAPRPWWRRLLGA